MQTFRFPALLTSCCLLMLARTSPAATNLTDWFSQGNLAGDIRLYDFTRDYAGTASDQPSGSPSTGKAVFSLKDMHSLSLGGKLLATTGWWDGFQAGTALYSAWDIGGNNYAWTSNKLYAANYGYPYLNNLLMGTHHTLDMLGEAWLKYQGKQWSAQGGRILVDNPWVNPSDGFMIPNLYQGVSLQVHPNEAFTLSADRVTEYKNRTTTSFDQATIAALPYDKLVDTGIMHGTMDTGLQLKNRQADIQAWWYNFYDLASMAYLEGGIHPAPEQLPVFLRMQYAHETGNGQIGQVDATIWGAKTGIALPGHNANIFLAWNQMVSSRAEAISANISNPVSNGNFFSPYTQIYNTDPLYTTVMNYGLVSARAPGHAWLIGATLHPFGAALDIMPTYSQYLTAPVVADGTAWMIDVAWHASGRFAGLSIRNRLGVEHDIPLAGSAYVDDRFMLQYNF